MRRVTDGEREKGGGIVMVFAVRVDNLCSIKADGIMAGAVVWSEDGRLCLGGAQARWIQGLPQLDLSPAKRKLGLSIRWILLNPSSFPLGKVHGGPEFGFKQSYVPYRQERLDMGQINYYVLSR